MFTHLHVHSHYSLLDGLPKIPQLLDAAKQKGMNALAITDHGVLYGAIEFFKEAKKRDIKPIIGCEIYVAPRKMQDREIRVDTRPYHLVLLAKNQEGYKNLLALVSSAHLEGYYYKPRVDKDLLRKHAKGLVALSACLSGEIARKLREDTFESAKEAAEEYRAIFGKDFYLEIAHHPGEEGHEETMEKVLKLAKETKISLVATNDVHYINKDDAEAQDAMLCIQTGRQLAEKDRMTMTRDDYSLKNPEEMKHAFERVPEAILNSEKIAQECELEIEIGVNHLPNFEVPQGESKRSYLEKQVYQGAALRFLGDEKASKSDLSKEVVTRLDYELSVIEKMGFESYFLIVQDFVKFAKESGVVVGPGRGSAAGSLVSYVLDITDLDPLEYKLLFERFLNPERISMPDIDLDFADDRRDEVIQYVTDKYGEERVAQIITFGTMAARNSVRDVGRVLGMSYTDVDRIAKLIPFNSSLDQAVEQVEEIKNLIETDYAVQRLIALAKKLEGCARHASTHAAGVVISEKALIEYAPLQRVSTDDASIVTQYSMNHLEAIGLLKMDFLGLSNLTVIQNTLNIIEKTRGEKLDLKTFPAGDKKSYQLLAKGETTGVFQLESEGMKKHLRELKPTTFEDIISMVALYRPGPMESIPDFIEAKHGRREITYLDPKLEPILKDSYGIIVTQDQVLEIARSFAGFTYGEADILRKAVGKKIKALLDEQHEKFVNGAEKLGATPRLAENVWAFIEPFARYGFNRAHAACYAMIAYQTAFLKANYPAEFMAALLTSDVQNIDRISKEIGECSRLGIKVLPPDVNESFANFTVLPDNLIRFGLSAIKNVGSTAVDSIILARKEKPFETLEDFVLRVDSRVVNKKVLESLAKCGALDKFNERGLILANLDRVVDFAGRESKVRGQGQSGLFIDSEEIKLQLEEVAPASSQERMNWERELLGIFIGDHPLTKIRGKVPGIMTYAQLESEHEKKTFRFLGLVKEVQRIVTKNNEPMAFVKLDDLTGIIELVIFPSVYKVDPKNWIEDAVVVVEGKLDLKDGVWKMLVNKYKFIPQDKLSDMTEKKVHKLLVRLPLECGKELMIRLKDFFAGIRGNDLSVLIEVSDGTTSEKVELPFQIANLPDLKIKLKDLFGEGIEVSHS